ncbi:hypothetical protein [Cetobacterium sp.]|uniref:hypothetical protein n=1 Tax=Cetobacterium sp. TaxID=2071632 RepID=UPI003F2C4229
MDWDINYIESIISNINDMLEQGKTMAEIEKNEFSVNARVIHKRLERLGYKRIDNQYTLTDIKGRQNVGQKVGPNKKDKEVQVVRHKDRQDVEILSSNNIDKLFDKEKDIEKLKGLITRYDEIVSFLDKISPVTISENIIINLPIEEGKKDFKATVRINKLVWEQFNEFCKERKQYSKKDLISQALIEFIENHS